MSQSLANSTGSSSKKRIDWIDISKGLAITAIIIGHFDIYFFNYIPWAHSQLELLYSFHVALFFIVTGYCMKKGFMGPKAILTLFKRTAAPYVVAGLLSITFCWLISPDFHDMKSWTQAFAYGADVYRGHLLFDLNIPYSMGILWFLPALFFGKLLASALTNIHIIPRLVIAGALFVFGDASANIVFLPMGIQQGMCAAWYITCGYVMKDTGMFETEGWEKVIVCLCITAGVGYMYVLGTEQLREPLYCNSTYYNGVIDMLGTVCAAMYVMLVARLISCFGSWFKRGIEWMGRNSLAMFSWHAIMFAPGLALFSHITGMIDNGAPALPVFIVATVCGVALAAALAALSMRIAPLRWAFFPTMKKAAKEKGAKRGTRAEAPAEGETCKENRA